jgi:hypothetical protein
MTNHNNPAHQVAASSFNKLSGKLSILKKDDYGETTIV